MTLSRGWRRQTAAVRYLVDVEGAQVEVERPWSKQPRLYLDGDELSTDRWERRLLTMSDGSQHEVRVGYRAVLLGPRLEVAGRHYPIGRPLPTWVLVALGAFAVLGFWGGALGALLALGASVGAVRLLIHPQRTRWHVAAAVALPLVAVVVTVALARLFAVLL